MEDFQTNSEMHLNMHNHGLQVLCVNLTSDMKGVYSVTTKLHSPLPSKTFYKYATVLHAFHTYIHLFEIILSCHIFVKFHYITSEPEQDLLLEQ